MWCFSCISIGCSGYSYFPIGIVLMPSSPSFDAFISKKTSIVIIVLMILFVCGVL